MPFDPLDPLGLGDPEPNWASLEETPKADPDFVRPTAGNTAFCYTCGLDLRKLHDDMAKRVYYPSCFITLCVWCDRDFRST